TTTRTQGSSSSTYTWGGGDQNELVSTTTGTNTTSYVYGRNDPHGVPMLQSFTKNAQTSYVDTDPTGSPIALHTPGGVHYYALDNQGSPVNLIGSAGTVSATYTYDPAGRQLTATGASAATNPVRYTQGLLDENTGWLKHGVRWHDTTTANWTAIDPINPVMEPNAASRYTYVDGNPANRVDPTGRATCGESIFNLALEGALLVGSGVALAGITAATGGAGVALAVGGVLGGGYLLP
ncbi:hypothetical protein K7G98_32610, partial [Saccharothrix sp. MB29]|nr:hypothetical protein [Saccharothrix sp. MB29]